MVGVTRINQETNTVTDMRTGEAVSETKTTSTVINFPAEPPYIKMYIRDLCRIQGVGDADQALLRHLLARLDFDGYVTLSPRSKESICASLGVTAKTFRNRLTRLVSADIIKGACRNEYQVNPKFFARGKWKDVCAQKDRYELDISISYSEAGGRQITTNAVSLDGDAEKQQNLI